MKNFFLACALLTGCAELQSSNTENGPADSFGENELAAPEFATEAISAGSLLAAPIDLGNILITGNMDSRRTDNIWYPDRDGTVSYTFTTPRNSLIDVAVGNASAAELQPTRGNVIRLLRDQEGILRFAGSLDGTYRLVIGPWTAPAADRATETRRFATLNAGETWTGRGTVCVVGGRVQGSEIRSTTRYAIEGQDRNSLYRYIGSGRTTRTNAFVRVSQTLRWLSLIENGAQTFDSLRFLSALPSSYDPYLALTNELGSGTYVRVTLRGDDGQTYELHSFEGHGLVFRSGSNVPVFAMYNSDILGCV